MVETEEKNLMLVSLYLISGQCHVLNQSADSQESAQYQAWPGKWTLLATLKSTPGFWQKWGSTPSFLLELTTGKRLTSGDHISLEKMFKNSFGSIAQ
jgi:hypothetical protein